MSALGAKGSTRSWRRIRAYILDRDGHRCQVPDFTPDGQPCGAWADHVDHVVSRFLGGTDHPDNLRAACQPCNLRRGTGNLAVSGQAGGPPNRKSSRPGAPRWSW